MLNKLQLFMMTLVLLPGSLLAIDGFYMGVGTGVNQRFDSEISALGVPSSSFEYTTGYMLNLNAGYTFDTYRVELEVYSSSNKAKSITLGSDTASASGTAKTYAQYLNFYYDYSVANDWEVYGALGVGYARLRLDSIKNDNANVVIADSDDGSVSYQVKIGGTYQLRKQLQLVMEARYLHQRSIDFVDQASSQSFSINNDKQMALGIGLKYHFVME